MFNIILCGAKPKALLFTEEWKLFFTAVAYLQMVCKNAIIYINIQSRNN